VSVAFLSGEWFEALAGHLRSAQLLPGDPATGIRVGQLVTGAPGGVDHAWTLVLRGGSAPELEVGSIDRADVVLVESYEGAWALASGDRTPGQLLEAGEVKVRGDARRLVAASELLEAVAACTGGLREMTTRD
jgi:hypothetical protein